MLSVSMYLTLSPYPPCQPWYNSFGGSLIAASRMTLKVGGKTCVLRLRPSFCANVHFSIADEGGLFSTSVVKIEYCI